MALKFTEGFMQNIIADGFAEYNWKVEVLDNTNAVIDSATVSSSQNQDAIWVILPGSSKTFTIPVDTTVAKVVLKAEIDSTYVVIGEDTVSNGYYEYGGVFEITQLYIDFSYTKAS